MSVGTNLVWTVGVGGRRGREILRVRWDSGLGIDGCLLSASLPDLFQPMSPSAALGCLVS